MVLSLNFLHSGTPRALPKDPKAREPIAEKPPNTSEVDSTTYVELMNRFTEQFGDNAAFIVMHYLFGYQKSHLAGAFGVQAHPHLLKATWHRALRDDEKLVRNAFDGFLHVVAEQRENYLAELSRVAELRQAEKLHHTEKLSLIESLRSLKKPRHIRKLNRVEERRHTEELSNLKDPRHVEEPTAEFFGMVEETVENTIRAANIMRIVNHINESWGLTSQDKSPGTQHQEDPQHPPGPQSGPKPE